MEEQRERTKSSLTEHQKEEEKEERTIGQKGLRSRKSPKGPNWPVGSCWTRAAQMRIPPEGRNGLAYSTLLDSLEMCDLA